MRIELFHYKDVQNFLTKYLALAFTTLFLFQCSKDDTSDIAKNTELVTNTQLIIADNNSSAKILLFSENKSIPVTTEYILRMNGDIIDLDNFNFTTDTAGRYKFEAEYKGVITNTIEITAREDKVFERISIPVIFHVGHFGQSIETGTSNSNPNINASLLQLGLDDMNIIFSNNANSKEPNAVDTGVQFRLATKNPDGSLMAEPGVARYNVAAYDRGCFEFPNDPNCPDIEGNELLGPNEVGHWAIDSIWDPNLYFNIWIYPDKETRGSAGSPPVFNSHPLIGADLIAAGTTVEPSLNGIFPYMYLDYRRLKIFALIPMLIITIRNCLVVLP